jgi:serine/threonine protein kinase/tetratricopeptide (TPR) repeat protein
VIRRIGAGGMGVVHEAWDKERNIRVALKTLTGLDPRALQLFKNEFRALADVSHPNLAALYEFFAEEGQWFFSMEYVEGGHFLEHVRPGWHPAPLSARPEDLIGPDEPTFAQDAILPAVAASPPEVAKEMAKDVSTSSLCDTERLTASLDQLARAVLALHAAGILHRDLKPLNVKVAPEGRVVVLDFGLAAHAGPLDFGIAASHAGVVGTVPYMSPEQAAGGHVTDATDWYAVGVMVYEALTGQRPFEGNPRQVLEDKQRLAAPPVTRLADVSGEWHAICAGLLERDPARRMNGADLLALLERHAAPSTRPVTAARPAERIFVGRETQLALLREAFAATEANVPSLALVHGKSGIGKSSLVERFLAELAAQPNMVILAGRCYERESMPYKAFDSVVDSLARYLRALPRHEAAELTPRDAATLAQVFPVLRQVEAMASAPQRPAQLLDQYEQRRKAFVALREIFARLGDRRRVAVYIDDMQWGDVDSVTLLTEILRPPDAPAFLLVAAYRSEYEARSPALQALLTGIPEGAGLRRSDVLVGPLSAEETRSLAMRLIGRGSQARIEEIARDSEGSPYLLQEIADGSASGSAETTEAAGLRLDSVLYRRIAALPDDPRRLLRTVAVSVRPLGEREAFQAADIESHDPKVLVALRAARLIRGAGGGGEIEPYHDRVRETVIAHLSADRLAACHLRLATTLETAMRAGSAIDAEAAAIHFEGAGLKDKASQYYSSAAERAVAALAFKHAAELCQRALDLSPFTGEDRRRLVVKLADALGNAGRGAEAARAWREAARGAAEPEVFEFERREAYWFAISGHVDEGREALMKMLARVNVRIPGTLGRVGGIVLGIIWLKLRGLEFRRRPESEIPQSLLDRIDVYWDAVRSFGMIDVSAAVYMVPRCLLLSLRAGETGRIARVLALHNIGLESYQMPVGGLRIANFPALYGTLLAQNRSPYLEGMFGLSTGMVGLVTGRWRESARHFQEAERIFSQECSGVSWELATVRIFPLWDLLHSGRYAELCRRASILSQEGTDRGDLYQTITIALGPQPVCELIVGRPDAALRTIEEALRRWTRRDDNVQIAIAVFVRAWIDLYQGMAAAAWELLDREWPTLRKNLHLLLGSARQWLYFTRAESALAFACTAPNRGALLKLAERSARWLEGDEAPFARPLATLIRAGCASLRGDKGKAIALLEKAVADFDASDMAMLAAAARRRLGELTGGESGRSLIQESERAMRAEGVHDPGRLTDIFANGFLLP